MENTALKKEYLYELIDAVPASKFEELRDLIIHLSKSPAHLALYDSPEFLEAKEEGERLLKAPNRESFGSVAELFADCLEGDDDDE